MGRYTKFDVGSGETASELISLLKISFDFESSFNSYFALTHLSVGLTERNCCTLSSILIAEAQYAPVVKNFNGRDWVYVEYVADNGDVGAALYSVFSDSHVMFANLRVDSEMADDTIFVKDRLSLLYRVVGSVKEQGFGD